MKLGIASGIAAVCLVMASCASAPAQGKAPDWIFATPKPDATNTYFVGSASDATGDVAAATNDAAATLMSSITQYIGVKVNVATNGQAQATLDSYSANIKSTVTSASQNQVSGFSVKERYIQNEKGTKRVTVYVLAAYATDDLEKERARIADLMKEGVEAVEGPERDGNALLEQNRSYEAVRKFVEAAVAASGSSIDNSDVYLERNINSARTALSRIRFDVSASTGYKGLVGQDFGKPFTARILAGEGATASGIPGAVVQLSYQRRSGTRLVSKTESVMTDDSGTLRFTPPAPDFVGKAKLSLRLDFQSTLDLLDKVPDKYAGYRDSLAEELRAKYVDVPYEVMSGASGISMAIALVDLDENGVVVPGAATQAGLLDVLIRERFNVKGLPIAGDQHASLDDAAAKEAASANGFARVAFGSARITEVHKDGDTYLATGKATLKVLDVASGSVLYSAERGITGLGPDEKSARASVYRELGAKALGEDLLANLP
jgi:hypothetical protein